MYVCPYTGKLCFQQTFSFACLFLHVCAANMAAIPVFFNSFFFVQFLSLDPSAEAAFMKKSSLHSF